MKKTFLWFISLLAAFCLTLPANAQNDKKTEKALFGEGCFWHTEEIYSHMPGVISTMVGYAGGHLANPTYPQVCTHTTGHIETVLIEFDPTKLSYEKLLDVFFSTHDPTTLDRQGPDIGEQYKSTIFYFTPEQKAKAEEAIKKLQNFGKYKQKIVTEIRPSTTFYKAEDYHQKYFEKHGKGLFAAF